MDNSQIIFLLGGHDLEMIEIRRIIQESKLKSYDFNLDWGSAKLSAYTNILNNHNLFIGIELSPDIPLPKYYIEIDHHNRNVIKTSSLEQLIDLLRKRLNINIPITRDIQLITANDKGYIPAMKNFGATQEEIENIRLRDRRAQGVTEIDEQLAEESIIKHLSKESGITIVKSLTPKFSTITDRLFPYNKLLIYTDNELTYYGVGVSKLITEYDNLVMQGKAYSGGGENGFFGIANKCLPVKELLTVKENSILLLTN